MIEKRPALAPSGDPGRAEGGAAHRIVHDTGTRANVPPEVARPPRSYLLEIDEAQGTIAFLHGADRFTCDRRGTDIVITTTLGIDTAEFITMDTVSNAIAVRTHSAGLFPIFYRMIAGHMRLSNHAHLLLVPGEQVEVKAQIVAHQLAGSERKLYSPFAAIQRLQDNAEYRLSSGVFSLFRSRFSQIENASYDRLRDYLLQRYRAYAVADRPISVLLSGGYDSRLALVFALHACAKAGNQGGLVTAYHEHKNEMEQDISSRVAASVGVPLEVFLRTDSPAYMKLLSQEPHFVYCVGLHRTNLLRWTGHIRRIRELQGDAVRVIGLSGGEPHKGQYYRQVKDLDSDLLRIFGGGGLVERAVVTQFHNGRYENVLAQSIQSLTRQAKEIYEHKASRIDFVYYHEHMGEENGGRNRYFSDECGIDFPNYDEGFMNEAFSMPQSEKENYALVKRLTSKIASEAAAVPYVSGGYGRLKAKLNARTRIKSRLRRLLYTPPAKTGEAEGTVIDHEPGSALTASLAIATRAGHPLIRTGDTNIAYNYFAMLERDLKVGFSLV